MHDEYIEMIKKNIKVGDSVKISCLDDKIVKVTRIDLERGVVFFNLENLNHEDEEIYLYFKDIWPINKKYPKFKIGDLVNTEYGERLKIIALGRRKNIYILSNRNYYKGHSLVLAYKWKVKGDILIFKKGG